MRFPLFSLVFLMCAACMAAQQSASSPANAIFILGEGQGVGALSVPPAGVGSARPEGLTPNLERLAREGVRFSGFYASCPRCTPSRASFFTGVSPAKLHMTFGNDGNDEREKNTGDVRHLIQPEPLREIPADQTTIGDILGNAGWRTAHFGKWHVGRLDPARHGYAENDGPNTNMGPGRNRKPNPGEADLITDRGIAFMRDAVKAKKPFYLQLAHYGGGSEDEATAEAHARVKRLMPNARAKEAYQAAVLVDVDRTVGRLLDALDELGVAGRTYVFFSTDHGAPAGGEGGGRRGAGANAPYSGGKGSVREGGLRIPMIVRGPGIPKNEVSTVRAVGYDLAPTVADLLGVKTKDGTFEGKSLAPALLAERRGAVRRPEEFFVIHFPHYDLQNGGPASAIYEGSWKLIHQYETDTNRLYDLDADPFEENDRAAAEPERAKKLAQHLFDYLRNVKAQMPVPIDGAAPEKKEDQGADQRPQRRNAEGGGERRQGRGGETPRNGGETPRGGGDAQRGGRTVGAVPHRFSGARL